VVLLRLLLQLQRGTLDVAAADDLVVHLNDDVFDNRAVRRKRRGQWREDDLRRGRLNGRCVAGVTWGLYDLRLHGRRRQQRSDRQPLPRATARYKVFHPKILAQSQNALSLPKLTDSTPHIDFDSQGRALLPVHLFYLFFQRMGGDRGRADRVRGERRLTRP
jgi:hypothetical protein